MLRHMTTPSVTTRTGSQKPSIARRPSPWAYQSPCSTPLCKAARFWPFSTQSFNVSLRGHAAAPSPLIRIAITAAARKRTRPPQIMPSNPTGTLVGAQKKTRQ
ncbi:hypothetical protein EFD56_28960 [Rhizobium phaseoli]|nr:hypothetical protein EFD56_28960 [Rhizobium phaseoli]